MKINVWALGLAFGLVWACVCILVGIFGMFDRGLSFIEMFSDFYIGYDPTWLGIILGAIWGFLDGFIGGVLIAFLYNFFTKK